MKSFRDYITETETWMDNPVQGDDFDIELAPDELLESYIVDVVEDGIVIAGDERVMGLLESFGHTTEEIRRYGPVGSNRGVGFTLEETNEEEAAEEEVAEAQHDDFDRVLELAGCGRMREEANTSDPLADKAAALAPVSAQGDQDPVDTIDEDGVDPVNQYGQDDEEMTGAMTAEAEYQGRKVPLGKPMRGDTKKFKVYVKDPATGNIKKVNFGHGGTSAKKAGQKTMKIKKSNPARRKSFRARHNCDNPGPRTKARYWSCRAW
jgi:hypothetical protein